MNSAFSILFEAALCRASSTAGAELSTPSVAIAPILAALSEKAPEKQNRSSTLLPRQYAATSRRLTR